MDNLSLEEARNIAITAQGFDQSRAELPVTRNKLKKSIERLGVLQIDSVNVLARAHTLPSFSRLGLYSKTDFESLSYGGTQRAFFEYWGHAASLLPVDLFPFMQWRMNRAKQGIGIYPSLARFGVENKKVIDRIREEIASCGPLSAQELAGGMRGEGSWWGWSEGKFALEWLFWAGVVTTAIRRPTFERVYDLVERVLPSSIFEQQEISSEDAHVELLDRSSRALGVATEACLRDYYRLGAKETRVAIQQLLEMGRLRQVAVESWTRPAYLHASVKRAKPVNARSLLVPFDPLIWYRQRAEFLLGAHIRIEIYTPKEKRIHGYYVLPFLLGNRIVARVDLKANRPMQTLDVIAVHSEPGVKKAEYIDALAAELHLLMHWLGLADIHVGSIGDGARPLRAVVLG
jgi:uncharacterized protein YcaQ